MDKIKVANPVVELDGDEMTRIIWHYIRDKLIHPYLDVDLLYYDLSVEHRDATGDQVTIDSAERDQAARRRRQMRHHHARRGAREGIQSQGDVALAKRHDPQHPRRGDLPRTDHRPQRAAPRAGLDAADRDRPPCLRRPVPGDGFRGARQGPADHQVRGPGRYGHREGGVQLPRRRRRHGDVQPRRFDPRLRPGVAELWAEPQNYPVYLSTKNTILKKYDGRFKDLFQEIYDQEFKSRFQAAGITYEHRLIDDMVASAMKWSGGYVWACKNYDGDVQSDTVAQGFGSLGLMTSVLMTPDGKTVEAEAAHGTVTRHYREHQKGKETSTNSIASIFAWTRGLAHRAKLDDNAALARFASTLETVCVDTVEAGFMTKDLALLVGPDQRWLSTTGFLDKIDDNLKAAMA